MSTNRTTHNVTRRSAVAGLGAGALGVALAASVRQTSAQDATPTAMASHPLVGTWIIDRDITDPTGAPSIVVFTADGGLLDPSQGAAGTWKATGPRSAAWNLVAFIQGGAGGYVAVRSTAEIDASGDTLAGPNSFTIVAPDGTVMMSGQANSTATRLAIEPVEAGGAPFAGFPTWTPAPPDATPTA